MKRLTVLVALVALGGITGAHARADFTYSSLPTTPLILPDTASSSAIFLTPTSGSALGSGDINVAQSIVVSFASPGSSSVFTDKAFGVALTLTDTPSGNSATFALTGTLSGTTDSGAANLSIKFDPPAPSGADLGANHYALSVTPGPAPLGTAPLLPGFSGLYIGSLTAHVDVTPIGSGGSTGGGVGNAPEPSTLVLSCFGLAGLGFAAWRRRRGARTALAA